MEDLNIVRKLRLQAGLSREALAAEAGVSLWLLTKYERGEVQRPSLLYSRKLAAALARRLGMREEAVLWQIAEGFACPEHGASS